MNNEPQPRSPFRRSGEFLSRFASEVSGRLPYISNGDFSETEHKQEVLKKFNNKFGVAGDILENENAERVEKMASFIVEAGIADNETVVELRMLLSEEDLWEPRIIHSGMEKMHQLQDKMAHEHGISAIPNSHPIMPTHDTDGPTDSKLVWSNISTELESFEHQMRLDSVQHGMAVVAITDTSYAERIFAQQGFFDRKGLKEQIMILRHVGDEPRENLLLPLHVNPEEDPLEFVSSSPQKVH